MTYPGDDQLPTIDDVVAVLRSPARADELQGEEEVVAAMAAAILADVPREFPLMTRSRPLKIAVIAGAAVLSLAGVAAATGALPDRAPSRPPVSTPATAADASASATGRAGSTSTTSTSSTSALSTTGAAETTRTAVDTAAGTPAPAITAPPCPADVTNHGDYVSRVAHDTPPGPDHGKIVSAAAQSDCGKGAAGAGGPASTAATAAATQHGRPHPGNGPPADHGNANGKGHGHG